jgi:ubiquinone/menaquinone biosynthesis C-methylase UbiE
MFKSFVSKRVLEPEAMMSLDEARNYDKLVVKYLQILHDGFVETVLNSIPDGSTILEVGTGSGRISIELAKYNPTVKVTGIELSDDMITVANENKIQAGVGDRVNFTKGDAKKLPFEDAFFDVVVCHNMMHHLPDPFSAVQEMKRVLKDDGGFFLRDLRRPAFFFIPLHVHILGFSYNDVMKRQYRDSIKAAFSDAEWEELFKDLAIPEARLLSQFITHRSIERKARNSPKRRIKIPTPFHLRIAKNFYVSSAD